MNVKMIVAWILNFVVYGICAWLVFTCWRDGDYGLAFFAGAMGVGLILMDGVDTYQWWKSRRDETS